MTITNAIYIDTDHSSISVDFDGQAMSVPVNLDNRHYAEIVEQGIEIAPYVEPEPSWYELIAATDKGMPRIAEDIIDTMTPTQFNKLPERAKDNYEAKKVLRGQQP